MVNISTDMMSIRNAVIFGNIIPIIIPNAITKAPLSHDVTSAGGLRIVPRHSHTPVAIIPAMIPTRNTPLSSGNIFTTELYKN